MNNNKRTKQTTQQNKYSNNSINNVNDNNNNDNNNNNTETEEEKDLYLMNNLNMLDYLYNMILLSDNQYTIALKIKKAFQQQREFKTIITYEKKYTNNKSNTTINNINNDTMVNITEANRNYLRIQRILNNEENKLILEQTICLEIKTINYLNQLNNNKNKFYDLILKICNIFDELEDYFYGSEYERRIGRLSNNICEYGGINKVSKKLNISYNTIIKILKKDKNFRYSILERLERFLNLR